MSADPFVQAPYNSQSYNRYSYVFNSPLSFTDPSGYQTCGDPGPTAPGGVTLPCGTGNDDPDTGLGSDAWYWSNYYQQQEQQKQQYENGFQYLMAKFDRWWINYVHENYVNTMDPNCQKSVSKTCDGPKWTSEDAENLTNLTVAGLAGGVGKLQLADPKRLVLEAYKASNGLSIVQNAANQARQLPLDKLLSRLNPAERANYEKYPGMRNMLLGTAMHRETAAKLMEKFPGRFDYNPTRKYDFIDKTTGEIIELPLQNSLGIMLLALVVASR